MVTKKRDGKRSSTCHLRSECKAKWNRRYYERLFSRDWEHLVIKRDAESGQYKMDRI